MPTADAQESSRPFGVIVKEWNRTLDGAQTYINGVDHFEDRSRNFRSHIGDIRDKAIAAAAKADGEISKLQTLLDALGPEPKKGELDEKAEIAKQRAKYKADVTFYRANVSQADLAIARANALESTISTMSRARLFTRLLEVNPLPLAPDTIIVAIPGFFQTLQNIAATPVIWWSELNPEQRTVKLFFRMFLFLILALVAGWAVRHFSLKFFGRDILIENPSYARRLVGAVSEGVARGIFPAIILGALLFRLASGEAVISGPFAEIIAALCKALILYVLAWALSRAVLAPDLPHWRLTVLAPNSASSLSYWITVLAVIVAIDYFLSTAAFGSGGSNAISKEVIAFYKFVTLTVKAGLLIAILHPSMWKIDEDFVNKPEDVGSHAVEATPVRNNFWYITRSLLVLMAGLAVVVGVLGYGQLSVYLIGNLIAALVICSGLFLLRGLLRETVAIALRSLAVSRKLTIQLRNRRRAKFWLRAILDIVIFISALFLVVPLWGVPADDLYFWTNQFFHGFTIGNVTISLLDFTVGVFVFLVVMFLSRTAQRALSERVLPETALDIGLQQSLATVFGYLGVIFAVVLGVAAVGVDLSNIALIAGALSVGIGFGLQTIVSNLVAGITLLVERPIKVGDWIVVGDQQGIVKRIKIRSTEIETFERNSVIVPNAAFLQDTVINRTHKDRISRIEVPIGVAYGSDVKKVEKILRDVAKDNPKIAADPEPFVLFQNFGASSLDFELRCFCPNVSDTIRGASELRFSIDEAFRREGIEIPFPQRDINIKGIEGLENLLRQIGKNSEP